MKTVNPILYRQPSPLSPMQMHSWSPIFLGLYINDGEQLYLFCLDMLITLFNCIVLRPFNARCVSLKCQIGYSDDAISILNLAQTFFEKPVQSGTR
jgi:hypothetical protein